MIFTGMMGAPSSSLSVGGMMSSIGSSSPAGLCLDVEGIWWGVLQGLEAPEHLASSLYV